MTPNDPYMGRTAPLTSKHYILYIYSTNVGTEYFKHALYSPFVSLQNAVCFIMLTCLVPVLFIFYTQGVLKLKKNNSGAKGLISSPNSLLISERRGLFILGQNGRNLKLTTHLYLAPKLRMSGATQPCHHMPSRLAQA